MKYLLALFICLSGGAWGQLCAPSAVLRPASQITGNLDQTSCTLADGTWFADYPVQLPVRGAWTASVTPSDGATAFTVVLRDTAGTRLALGNSVQRNLEAGTYHVLVNGPSANQGGGFSLATTFSGAANVLCRNFGMLGTIRSIAGSLGPGSCQLPDSSAYDGYHLTLYGAGSVDVAITASGFAPLLMLRTSDGHAIGIANTPDDSGVVHLTLDGVGSDTYTLIAAVSSPDQAGGSYTVSATFTPADGETCVSSGVLSDSQQPTGTISDSSCDFNLPGREDFAPFNFYNVHVASAGSLRASLDTSDFSALLLLLDADGNPIANDTQSGGSGSPIIQQQLPAGDYLLVVFNEESFGGKYTLDYQFTAGPATSCTVTRVDSGAQMNGILSAGASCKDASFLSDVYRIDLPADGTVNLSLSSPDFSTFLDLHDSKDNELTWGAQSADGTASFLTADLPAGTYYVDAASMDLPGGYLLSYTFAPKTLAACPTPRQMPPNGFIENTQLTHSSCTGPDGRQADYYTFTLPAASTEAIFMTSDSILTDITLYQQDGTPLRSDQNSYAGDNAVIVQYLPAGQYSVRARSSDPTELGAYNLYLAFVQGAAPQLCAPRQLPLSGATRGTTSFTSCAWNDKTFADLYQLNVNDITQMVTIAAQAVSPDPNHPFDPSLILMDVKGNILSTDENSGGGLNALVVQTLDPGSYFVAIKPASDPTSAGSYVLNTTAMAVPDTELDSIK